VITDLSHHKRVAALPCEVRDVFLTNSSHWLDFFAPLEKDLLKLYLKVAQVAFFGMLLPRSRTMTSVFVVKLNRVRAESQNRASILRSGAP